MTTTSERPPRERAKPQPKATPVPLDPSAPGIVLAYQGGRTGQYVPARDLEGVDVARVAYRRAADLERTSRSRLVRPGEVPAEPRRPGAPTSRDIKAIADELVAGGAFVRVSKPDEPASPADKPEATA